jgi:hypothetical protein
MKIIILLVILISIGNIKLNDPKLNIYLKEKNKEDKEKAGKWNDYNLIYFISYFIK